MRRNRNGSFFILFLFLLWACQGSEEERIRQTLNERGEAFKKKDLSLYLSCISEDYQDKEGGFPQLRERIAGYFSAFDRISYESWDRSIEVEVEKATVTQQFRLEVEQGGKKNRYSGKEAFLMRKEGKGWKIFRGL